MYFGKLFIPIHKNNSFVKGIYVIERSMNPHGTLFIKV